MGIVNVSPDSFSGDGLTTVEMAVRQAISFVEHGADIIDLGGESTKPNSIPISSSVELSRLIPVIEQLTKTIDVPISVDSYKYDVVDACLHAGAHIINDVWGLQHEERLANLASLYNVPIILNSNQRKQPVVTDIIEAISTDLQRAISICHNAEVLNEQIIIDPGIGFGKTAEQNIEILIRLNELRCLGYPILIGTSRKGFIGDILDKPANERLAGTAVTNVIGIANGADIIRVHDVRFMTQIAKMSDILLRRKQYET
jgi:dihydropteroate synthase